MSYRTEYFDPKFPSDILDYVWDWSDWLNGDIITNATFSVPAGFTLNSQTNSSTTATAWITGGVANQSGHVTCTITTAGGRTAAGIGVVAVMSATGV